MRMQHPPVPNLTTISIHLSCRKPATLRRSTSMANPTSQATRNPTATVEVVFREPLGLNHEENHRFSLFVPAASVRARVFTSLRGEFSTGLSHIVVRSSRSFFLSHHHQFLPDQELVENSPHFGRSEEKETTEAELLRPGWLPYLLLGLVSRKNCICQEIFHS